MSDRDESLIDKVKNAFGMGERHDTAHGDTAHGDTDHHGTADRDTARTTSGEGRPMETGQPSDPEAEEWRAGHDNLGVSGATEGSGATGATGGIGASGAMGGAGAGGPIGDTPPPSQAPDTDDVPEGNAVRSEFEMGHEGDRDAEDRTAV